MTGLGGLFRDSRSPRGLVEENAVPRAIRPAVEIIARLSSERNKLREEVRRLRDRLRDAPREGDLEQLRAERDALAQELAVLKARGTTVQTSLIERLERAIARVEALPRERRVEAPPRERRMEALPRESRAEATTPRSLRPTRRPSPRGGGMLAGLVKENVSLRSDSVQRTPESPVETQSMPQAIEAGGRTTVRGGGLLRGLFSQNLSLRGSGKTT